MSRAGDHIFEGDDWFQFLVTSASHGGVTWDPGLIGTAIIQNDDSPVTLHVSAGAFDKTEYVVRPGGSITAGPARAAGSYTVWSEPAACQGPPRGVRGSGPGISVEAAPGR